MITKAAEDIRMQDALLASGGAIGSAAAFDAASKALGRDALAAMPKGSLFLPVKLREKAGLPEVNLVRSAKNAFDPLTNTVYFDGSAAVAHELGHAQSPLLSRLGRRGTAGLNLANYANSRYTALPLALALHTSSDDDSSIHTASGIAAGAFGAAQAAQLAEEGGASLRGLRLLRGELSPAEMARARRAFLKAFGSYAVPAVGAGAAAAGIGAAVKSHRELSSKK